MDINPLVLAMGFLICPLVMGLMMWWMSRGGHGHGHHQPPRPPLEQEPAERL